MYFSRKILRYLIGRSEVGSHMQALYDTCVFSLSIAMYSKTGESKVTYGTLVKSMLVTQVKGKEMS